MIDVWQFIFVRGSVHPQPMARSQTRKMFNRFSIDALVLASGSPALSSSFVLDLGYYSAKDSTAFGDPLRVQPN